MTAPIIRRIHDLTDKDLDDIVTLCLRAFEEEAGTPAMVGGNDELRPLLFRAMIRAGALEGSLYVLEINQLVVSMTLWFAPGQKLWHSEETRSLGFNEFMGKLDPYTRDWWKNTYAARAVQLWKDITTVPREKMWFTNILATDPVQQRHGYGSMLMEFVLKNDVEPTAPTYAALGTTSKENEKFYNNLGYPTVGSDTMPNRFRPFPFWVHLMKLDCH